jgi:hypothetical protein
MIDVVAVRELDHRAGLHDEDVRHERAIDLVHDVVRRRIGNGRGRPVFRHGVHGDVGHGSAVLVDHPDGERRRPGGAARDAGHAGELGGRHPTRESAVQLRVPHR